MYCDPELMLWGSFPIFGLFRGNLPGQTWQKVGAHLAGGRRWEGEVGGRGRQEVGGRASTKLSEVTQQGYNIRYNDDI